MIDALSYRRVVGRFATGVTVVTTRLSGEDHAMTCNSFTSVSLEPLLVLFCAEKIARFHDAVLTAGTWAVSVLTVEQEAASRRFAHRGRMLDGQFEGFPVNPGPVTSCVLLDGAAASLECRTVSTLDAGDHTVVLGEVVGLAVPDADAAPLLYFEGRYRTIP